jgi:hemolysin-activating ACP:hemolysin acyltransferase
MPFPADHLAMIVAQSIDALGLARYVLLRQDHGRPVGFRLAAKIDLSTRRQYWAMRPSFEPEPRFAELG